MDHADWQMALEQSECGGILEAMRMEHTEHMDSDMGLEQSDIDVIIDAMRAKKVAPNFLRLFRQAIDQSRRSLEREAAERGGGEPLWWNDSETYETGEPAVSARARAAMQAQGPKGITAFALGAAHRLDRAGALAAHRALLALHKHQIARGHWADLEALVNAIIAGVDGVFVNCGTGGEDKCSKVILLTLVWDKEEVVRIAHSGAPRARFESRRDLQQVLDHPNLPVAMRNVLMLATAVTLPSWLDLCLCLTHKRRCEGLARQNRHRLSRPQDQGLQNADVPPAPVRTRLLWCVRSVSTVRRRRL